MSLQGCCPLGPRQGLSPWTTPGPLSGPMYLRQLAQALFSLAQRDIVNVFTIPAQKRQNFLRKNKPWLMNRVFYVSCFKHGKFYCLRKKELLPLRYVMPLRVPSIIFQMCRAIQGCKFHHVEGAFLWSQGCIARVCGARGKKCIWRPYRSVPSLLKRIHFKLHYSSSVVNNGILGGQKRGIFFGGGALHLAHHISSNARLLTICAINYFLINPKVT